MKKQYLIELVDYLLTTTSEFMGLVVVNYQEWLIGSWLMDLLKY